MSGAVCPGTHVHECACHLISLACLLQGGFNKSAKGSLPCAPITDRKIREFKDPSSSLPIEIEKVYPAQIPHRNTSCFTVLLPVHTAVHLHRAEVTARQFFPGPSERHWIFTHAQATFPATDMARFLGPQPLPVRLEGLHALPKPWLF